MEKTISVGFRMKEQIVLQATLLAAMSKTSLTDVIQDAVGAQIADAFAKLPAPLVEHYRSCIAEGDDRELAANMALKLHARGLTPNVLPLADNVSAAPSGKTASKKR